VGGKRAPLGLGGDEYAVERGEFSFYLQESGSEREGELLPSSAASLKALSNFGGRQTMLPGVKAARVIAEREREREAG